MPDHKRGNGPTTGSRIAVAVALLLIDLLVVAWLLYGYGITGWADAHDPANPPEAPHLARRSAWLLSAGAIVTGGGLLLLRRWTAGTVQLAALGGAAALFAFLAAR
ncbi:hypothetical protein ABZ135_13380 [Streptomyces sp. NPDC006339]|uniref:hypothetical protein n=1 Tax=Streptomyces sp. NPDC006339 TaxID=3156755 RepID=UPI0033B6C2DD